MKALSVRQPYAWLIAQGIKDVENRAWRTSYRGPLLIHAPMRVEAHALARFAATSWASLFPSFDAEDYPTGGIIGMVTLIDIVTRYESPWFVGPYGWVVRDAQPVSFVPMRGALHLFEVNGTLLDCVEVAAHA